MRKMFTKKGWKGEFSSLISHVFFSDQKVSCHRNLLMHGLNRKFSVRPSNIFFSGNRFSPITNVNAVFHFTETVRGTNFILRTVVRYTFQDQFPVKIILPRKFKIKSNMAFKLSKRTEMLLLMRRRTIAKNKYKKRFWVCRIFQERKQKGEYHLLLQDLRLHDHEYVFKCFRISHSKYEELLRLVAPFIRKCSLKRESIGPSERLSVTLHCLATGDSQTTIAMFFLCFDTWLKHKIWLVVKQMRKHFCETAQQKVEVIWTFLSRTKRKNFLCRIPLKLQCTCTNRKNICSAYIFREVENGL